MDIRHLKFVDCEGKAHVFNEHYNFESAESLYLRAISNKDLSFNISDLKFYDPENFVAGNVNSKAREWKSILGDNDSICINWLEQGVRIQDFIQPFSGNFRGKKYNSDFPLNHILPNANKCKRHINFINETILERLKNGSIFCKGRVGDCTPPSIVSGLTVEEEKNQDVVSIISILIIGFRMFISL